MLNKNTYSKTNYFLNSDLINKYNILDFNQKPILKLIKLNISLSEFFYSISSDKYQLNNIKNKNFIKKLLFFLSYYFSPYLFYIKLNKILSKKNSKKDSYLQLIIKGESNIYSFLTLFLVENLFIIKQIKNFFFEKIHIKSLELKNLNTFFITQSILSSFFFDFNYFISSLFSHLYIKDLLLNFYFEFKKNKNLLLRFFYSFVQNLFLFWI